MPLFDLSGVLNIQKSYLDTVLQGNVSSNEDVQRQMTAMQGNLNSLYTSLLSANLSTSAALDHQSDMINIVTNENDRLIAKQNAVNDALNSKKRMIALNDSYRKQQQQYVYILIILTIAGLIYIAASTYLPGTVGTIIAILDFTVAILLIGQIVYTIYSRDTLDFDKLYQGGRPAASDIGGNASTAKVGSILSLSAGGDVCVGPACCDARSVYDYTNNKCVPRCEQPKNLLLNGACTIATTDVHCRDNGVDPHKKMYGNLTAGNATCGPEQSPFMIGGFTTLAQSTSSYNGALPFSPDEYTQYSRVR